VQANNCEKFTLRNSLEVTDVKVSVRKKKKDLVDVLVKNINFCLIVFGRLGQSGV
jgi:hypothetical protein